MKIISYTQPSFRSNKSDLSFVKRIRDIDVSVLDSLQKNKVEVLLKLREAKKTLESYKETINILVANKLENLISVANTDVLEIEQYIETLQTKLREINLKILAEEEKNY